MATKKRRNQFGRLNRKIHYWGALICALPVVIIISSGMLLMLKKDVAWIQPPTIRGTSEVPMLPFEEILAAAQSVPEAGISTWEDVDRLDVRANKGVTKIRGKNHWEVQIDHQSGEVLQVAYRRSDIIESIHDGSFFHDNVKYFVFLPSAVILFVLWVTGIYLFLQPILAKRRRKGRQAAAGGVTSGEA